MTLIFSDTNRLSSVVKHEYEPSTYFCRELVTVNEGSALTYKIGTVLGKTLSSAAATSAAGGSNTGNGTMGSVTVAGSAAPGVYTLTITAAATNAGTFKLVGPYGNIISTTGTVAVAFNGGGLNFTLADGSTDFVVGDTFTITVTGTVIYKRVESSATDNTNVAAAIYIADNQGHYGDTAIAATTNTQVLALVRGPVILGINGLIFGASVDSAPKLAVAYDQLKQINILVSPQV